MGLSGPAATGGGGVVLSCDVQAPSTGLLCLRQKPAKMAPFLAGPHHLTILIMEVASSVVTPKE
jgi:hypothetical protein